MYLKYLKSSLAPLICSLLLISTPLTGCMPAHKQKDHETTYSDTSETMQGFFTEEMPYNQAFYVPTYLKIKKGILKEDLILSATLNIRNTSRKYKIYVSKVDYYNHNGELKHSYLDKTLELNPMQTVQYPVEKQIEVNGDGASFVVDISGEEINIAPQVDVLMVGEDENKGFIFDVQSVRVPHE